MKARLEFDLEDPGDELNHWMCINAHSAFFALNDIENTMRSLEKYPNSDVQEDKISIARVREIIRDHIDERSIRKDGLL